MKNKLEIDKIRELLKHICSYEPFIKSPKYTHFLNYLVEQALKENDLKEQTIGMELFQRNYNDDKNDGIVRVYMYNLRKKLKTYYSEIGKNDDIRFVLEKGSYNIKFVKNNNPEKVIQLGKIVSYFKTTSNKVIFLTALIILLISYAVYQLQNDNNLYCWKPFFKDKAKNICILADQVILKKKNAPIGNLISHEDINSASDFISFTKKNSIDSLVLVDYTYFTKAVPHAIQKLTHLFTKQNQEFSQISESEFKYEDAKRNNLIYVGQYKTMNVSKEIFLKNSKVFKVFQKHFTHHLNGETKKYKPDFEEGLTAEYAMVSFVTLSTGNTALYFVSNHDMGTIATIDKFTNLNFLKEFYRKLPSKDSYFNALFRVEGIGRTDVSCTLVKLEVIE